MPSSSSPTFIHPKISGRAGKSDSQSNPPYVSLVLRDDPATFYASSLVSSFFASRPDPTPLEDLVISNYERGCLDYDNKLVI